MSRRTGRTRRSRVEGRVFAVVRSHRPDFVSSAAVSDALTIPLAKAHMHLVELESQGKVYRINGLWRAVDKEIT